MKKLLCILLFLQAFAYGQNSVGIGTTAPNPSSVLDITGTRGLLIPRMDSTSRLAIVSPAKGLMVMDTSTNLLYRYNGKVWSRFFSSAVQNLSITGSVVAWDYELGDYAQLTLTGNITLNIQNPVAGMTGILEVRQDATGERLITFPPGSTASGGSINNLVLSTAPNAVDILSFVYNGQQYFWYIKNNF